LGVLSKAVEYIAGGVASDPGAVKVGAEVISAGSGLVDGLIAKGAVTDAAKTTFETAAKTVESDAAAAGAKIAGLKETVTAPFSDIGAEAGATMAGTYADVVAEAAGKQAPAALKGAAFASAEAASKSAVNAGFVDGLAGKIAASDMASKEVRKVLGLKAGVKITKDHIKDLIKSMTETKAWKSWGRICMFAGVPAGALIGGAAIGYNLGGNEREEEKGERTEEQFQEDGEWGKNSAYWIWVVGNACFGSHIAPERLPSLVDLIKNCPQGIIERACEQITMMGSLSRIVESPQPRKK